jgi:2'-5' RNA ligase
MGDHDLANEAAASEGRAPGTVGSRARLFIAFRLPPAMTDAVVAWQSRALDPVPGVRVLSSGQLHITAVFLGSRLEREIETIAATLDECARAAKRPAFHVYQYRETSRVGMLVLKEDRVGDDACVYRGNELTGHLMSRLEALGMYRREHRGWTPHITVARFRTPPRLAPRLSGLDSFSPAEIVLYRSTLQASGAIYQGIAVVRLPD